MKTSYGGSSRHRQRAPQRSGPEVRRERGLMSQMRREAWADKGLCWKGKLIDVPKGKLASNKGPDSCAAQLIGRPLRRHLRRSQAGSPFSKVSTCSLTRPQCPDVLAARRVVREPEFEKLLPESDQTRVVRFGLRIKRDEQSSAFGRGDIRHVRGPPGPDTQFQEELEKFQQAIDAREDFVSCAFVVLMAHGLEGRLKGEDERMVELEDLFQALNNKNCRALRAKPKVYIVQACRGEQRDPGEPVTGGHLVMITEESPETIPTHTDTLHVFSTIEGYIAYRHDQEGSYFIQTLVDVFINKRGPILELLTEVTRRMAEAEMVQEGEPKKVNPEIQSTLRKRLYLQ
ncbi:hypothetical protein AB1E18_006238 [Capra hircus]